jgi:hypothetical protein
MTRQEEELSQNIHTYLGQTGLETLPIAVLLGCFLSIALPQPDLSSSWISSVNTSPCFGVPVYELFQVTWNFP